MDARAILFVLVCGIAAVNSLLLAIFLWVRGRGSSILNRLLALLLLTFTVRVGKTVVVVLASSVHQWFELTWMAMLGLTGPLALVYASRLRREKPSSRRLVGASVAAAVSAVAAYALLPLGVGWKLTAAAVAVFGSTVAFIIPLAREAGGTDAQALLAARWLRAVLGFLLSIWALHAALVVARLAAPVSEDAFFNVEAGLFSAAVYALIYVEQQHGVLARAHAAARDLVAPGDPMLRRLRQAMEDERLYLDASLSLPSLARRLNLSRDHVSRLVNGGVGCGFNDYVNRLRIEEAQRLLREPGGANRRIGLLAFDCGFNSVSVFYAAFRKFTGRTPTEYARDLPRDQSV